MTPDRALWINQAVAARMGLTPAHLDVLCGIASGQTNARIGRSLGLLEGGVRQRVSRMLRLVGANDRAHLVAICYDRGLFRPEVEREWLAQNGQEAS